MAYSPDWPYTGVQRAKQRLRERVHGCLSRLLAGCQVSSGGAKPGGAAPPNCSLGLEAYDGWQAAFDMTSHINGSIHTLKFTN